MPAEVVVVVGACGGVGASTLAALIALARSAAGPVGLVDLAPSGGGIEVLLGIEDEPGARWPDLDALRGSVAAADLDAVLPRWRGIEVLGGDRRWGPAAPTAVGALWPALVNRYATLVLDLPAATAGSGELMDGGPGSDPGPGARRVSTVVLTSQDVRGVAAALAVSARRPAGRGHLALRRRRAARVAPLEAAHVLDLPLLAMVPSDRRVAEATDRGLGPVVGPRSRLARSVAALTAGIGRPAGHTRG